MAMMPKLQDTKEYMLFFPQREGEKRLRFYDRVARYCNCSLALAREAARQVGNEVAADGISEDVYRKAYVNKALRIIGGYIQLRKAGYITGNPQEDVNFIDEVIRSNGISVPVAVQLYYLSNRLILSD